MRPWGQQSSSSRERKGERDRDRVASLLRITGDVQSSAQFQIHCVRKVVRDAGISLEAGLASDLVMPKKKYCPNKH